MAGQVSGVYAITNTVTGEQYIGSSKQIAERWMNHRTQLRGGRHNTRLQAAWNQYGEEAFRVDVLELVEGEDALLMAEQRWIAERQPAYNCAPTVFRLQPPLAKQYEGMLTHEQACRLLKVSRGKIQSLIRQGYLREADRDPLDERVKLVYAEDAHALLAAFPWRDRRVGDRTA